MERNYGTGKFLVMLSRNQKLMEESVVTVDVSKAARLQRALKWASGTKQVSPCVMPVSLAQCSCRPSFKTRNEESCQHFHCKIMYFTYTMHSYNSTCSSAGVQTLECHAGRAVFTGGWEQCCEEGEVTGDSRRLDTEEFYKLFHSPSCWIEDELGRA
jgi:hypothetical protein